MAINLTKKLINLGFFKEIGSIGLGIAECYSKFDNLIDIGHQVIAIDNLYTGRLSNIQALLADKNFTFINHDIISPIDLTVDWIFNFACPASPPHYQKDPIFTTKTSVLG